MRNSKKINSTILNVSVKGSAENRTSVSLVKEVEIPKIKTTSKISKLITLSNKDFPGNNIIKFDPKGFTSWTTFERFVKETYDIGFIKNLYLNKDVFNIDGGEKIGFLIVTKQEGLTFTGSQRLTRVQLEKIKTKVDKELESLNKNLSLAI